MENNKKNTRTENVIRNVWVGIICQILLLVFSFANRTVFIKMLGDEYLSINGLFTNILNMISFVELGFGTALIYMLYKPVAEDNIKKVQSIIKYYQKVYTIIGLTMFILGIMVIPFMKYIIKDSPDIQENLIVIYLMYLVNTCLGYFFAHKSAIINANQKNYIITIYTQVSKLLQAIIQIVVLVVTKKYLLYLIIQFLMTLLSSIAISLKANKMYPYIKERNIPDISKKEKKMIGTKVKSLILYRISPAILNGSDNLILSACVSLSAVGIYSNYYLITNYLLLFLNLITGSFETSIGNLNAQEDALQKENVYYKILYVCFFMYGLVCVLLMANINDFINIWLGKDYVFNNWIVLKIVLYIYINGLHFPSYSYRTTAALFDKMKLMPVLEVVLNIIISIILAKYLGIAGVFLGTSLAKIATFFWSDPHILYKYLFKSNNLLKYYLKYGYYMFISVVSGFLMLELGRIIPVTNYIEWILRACLMGVTTIGIFVGMTFKMTEFKEMKNILIVLFNKVLKRFNKGKECL